MSVEWKQKPTVGWWHWNYNQSLSALQLHQNIQMNFQSIAIMETLFFLVIWEAGSWISKITPDAQLFLKSQITFRWARDFQLDRHCPQGYEGSKEFEVLLQEPCWGRGCKQGRKHKENYSFGRPERERKLWNTESGHSSLSPGFLVSAIAALFNNCVT